MPTLSITKNWSDGSTLTQSQLDTAMTSVETFINTTKISSDNMQSGAVATATIASAAVDSTKLAANAVTTNAITDANVTLAKLASDATAKLNPTGTVLMFAGAVAPTGYAICDGSAVSRTTYSALFALLSTTYGTGDGTTTFNLPDCRGRAVIGAGTGSGLTARTLGDATIGAETHTLSTAEMPSHTHNYTLSSAASEEVSTGGVFTPLQFNSTAATSSTGGDGAHNNMQPSLVLNYIIKT